MEVRLSSLSDVQLAVISRLKREQLVVSRRANRAQSTVDQRVSVTFDQCSFHTKKPIGFTVQVCPVWRPYCIYWLTSAEQPLASVFLSLSRYVCIVSRSHVQDHRHRFHPTHHDLAESRSSSSSSSRCSVYLSPILQRQISAVASHRMVSLTGSSLHG